MHKKLAYILMLAGTGSACAQSSLTLFGAVDASVSHYSTESTPYGAASLLAPQALRQSQTVLANSGNSASRLGFRGTEDLGGGLAASFWLESQLANDTGGNSLNFGRRSTVSLSGPFGEVRLGRDYTASLYNDAIFDPLATGVGINLIAVINTNLAASRALATGGLLGGGAVTDNYPRASNAISYFLPKSLGGFYGHIQYAFDENARGLTGTANKGKRGQYAGGRFGWANGPADVAIAYDESTVADTVTNSEKIKALNLGASYDFGVVKLFGELSRVKDQADRLLAPQIRDKYDGALIGLTIPVGVGIVRASYARVKYDNAASLINADASTSKIALGYVHNLSKRTALYTTVAKINIQDGRNNPTVMGVTPLLISLPQIYPQQPNYVTTGGFQPRGAMGYDIGIRHSF